MSWRQGRKKNAKRRTLVRPEHRAFASGLVSLLRPTGLLLWVTVRPPPTVRLAKLHLAVARLFNAHGCAHVAAMDWEKPDANSRLGAEKEHVHSIVYLPARELQPFCTALYGWAEKRAISAKAVDVQLIKGWPRYVGVEDRDELLRNVAQTFGYMMKPPKDGRKRSLDADVVARGVFLPPWSEFVATAKADDPVPAARACKFCCCPLSGGTKRRAYCDEPCRRKYHRREKRTSYTYLFREGDVHVHRRVRPRRRSGLRSGSGTSRWWIIR